MKRLGPYLLMLPGGLWLAAFFVAPMVTMLSLSLQEGDVVSGFTLTWHWQMYADAIRTYHPQLERSLRYGAIATAIQILIAHHVVYWIAFNTGGRRTVYLFPVLPAVAPGRVRRVLMTFVPVSSDHVNASLLGRR